MEKCEDAPAELRHTVLQVKEALQRKRQSELDYRRQLALRQGLKEEQRQQEQTRIGQSMGSAARAEADEAVAALYHHYGLPFTSCGTAEWARVFKAFRKAPADYKPPDRKRVAGPLLDAEFLRVKKAKDDIIQSQIEVTGCTLVSDGLKHQGNDSINILVETIHGTAFQRNFHANGSAKTATFIANEVIIPAIEELGPANVTSVCMDSAANCKLAGDIVEKHYREKGFAIFCYPCATHGISLFFKDVCRLEPVAQLDREMRLMIQFILNHEHTAERLRQLSQLTLHRVATTRFATVFICLDRLCELKAPLRQLVSEPEYTEFMQKLSGADDTERGLEGVSNLPRSPRARAEKVKQLVLGDRFWNVAEDLVEFLTPAIIALRTFDQGRPDLGEVWPTMQEASEEFGKGRTDLKKRIAELWDIRWDGDPDGTWDGIHRPIHSAAFALNPRRIHRLKHPYTTGKV
eukprot:SAG31_NODE_4372_length_3301_cov_3.460962_3_plen_462_part_00